MTEVSCIAIIVDNSNLTQKTVLLDVKSLVGELFFIFKRFKYRGTKYFDTIILELPRSNLQYAIKWCTITKCV